MSFMGGVPGKTSVAAEYSNTDNGVSLTETRLQGAVPVFKSEKSIWSVTARGQTLSLGETLRIGDRNFDIPKGFGSAEMGVSAFFPRESGTRGFTASFGTTGRRLFDSENSRVISLNYFSDWKTSPQTSWTFFLSYSNNRTFFNNIPLPGFAYTYTQDSFRIMAGLPFAFISWMPRPWILNASLSPFNSNADAGYMISGPWQVMASFNWSPRAFQNLTPDVNDERLMFDKKEAAIGARAAFGPMHSVSIAYVYQYDRRFYVGQSLSSRESTAADLADSGGIQFKMRTAF